eukprot:gene42498-11522_t
MDIMPPTVVGDDARWSRHGRNRVESWVLELEPGQEKAFFLAIEKYSGRDFILPFVPSGMQCKDGRPSCRHWMVASGYRSGDGRLEPPVFVLRG